MDAQQLSHLPRLENFGDKPYPVFEIATLTGQYNRKPITLCILGLYHYPGDPRGAPQCDVFMPDPPVDFLVYAGRRIEGRRYGTLFDVGELVPVERIRRASLYRTYTYESDTVKIVRQKQPRRSLREVVNEALRSITVNPATT